MLELPQQSSHSRSSAKKNPEAGPSSSKRKRSVTDTNDVSKRLCEDTELPNDLQDKSRQDMPDELLNPCQTNQYRSNLPHALIRFMYRLDLSVFCALRKLKYKHKYPSLLLALENSEIDKFNNIVLCREEKSIHVQIEHVDKYYIDNDISYAKLFTKKRRNFFLINDYFNSFVKHLISKSGNLLNDIEYLIIYTNSGLNLTEEGKLKQERFRNFYPFKFDRINIEKCDILQNFLFIGDNIQGRGFYQFLQDETTRGELLKRLEFSPAMQKVIKGRKLSQEFEKEIKGAFLDKLVFAVNQPNRDEMNSIVRSEIEKNSKVQDDYIALQEKVLCGLTTLEKHKKLSDCISGITYEFNLLMSFLHSMFLHKNMFSVNFEGKSDGISNNITINYRGRVTYVKAYTTNSSIGYSQLFPSKQQGKRDMFSINKHFTFFIEGLKNDIRYFIIYTDASIDLTEENILKKGRSKDFYPLKFNSIDIRKKKYKILRNCSCINENNLYQFAQEETTREKLLSLLKLPPSLQKEEGGLSGENEKDIKEKFLHKLILAVNQPNRENLNSVIKNEINKSNVPYNYDKLHEIALRWSESHEFGFITKRIMEKLLEDIKNNRSSYQEIQNKNIDEEIKCARSVVGSEGTFTFYQFLDFLIKGEGKKYLEVLKKKEINLTSVSSILHKTGTNAAKAFKDLYDLWFDAEGNKTQHLKALEKEGISPANVSSILHGARANAAKAFRDLYDLWFDAGGNKTQYLKTLEKEGISLANVTSILHGAGAKAAKAFKDLYNLWFDQQGNKKQYLEHFFKKKEEEKSFTLYNLSSILGGVGVKFKDAFEELHNVCFNDKGERTKLLDDFYKAGFRPSNLSCILCKAGVRASSVLKRLHSICFNDKGKRTKFLDDFYKIGFRPRYLGSILSGAADSLEKFHNFCFTGEKKRYLNHFFREGFTPKNLSNIFHGARDNVCPALKDFYNVCFNAQKKRTKLLDDFYKAGFRPSDLSRVLTMAGTNATSILINFHKLCFNKKNYLNHFLAEEELFTQKNLSKVLYGVGINICPTFKKLHDLCFDKAGNKTNYLNNLIKNNPSNKILNIVYKKIRKAPFLDDTLL